jgi:short-subunit dehydrogenase
VLAADLSDEHETERLLAKVYEQAGVMGVLINNAGLGDSVLFDRSEWARTRQLCGRTYLPWPSLGRH